jgi:RNA polymerase sigma-70 factor (sigma-E family)
MGLGGESFVTNAMVPEFADILWSQDQRQPAADGRAVRADDEQEYVDYVTSALPSLRRLAHLLCRDSHRAEDVVQTAITRLYVHWHRAKAAENLDAYVRTMVVRSFLNEQRLGWARVRLVGSPQDTPNLTPTPAPDIETKAVVHTALSRVAPRQRAVLVLRFLYDLPVAEVARVLGCSEGNVSSQTAQGLKRLRKLLGEQAVAVLGER